MNDNLKGYSTFSEIDNRMLRAFNQYNVLTNMRENKLTGLMTDYLAALEWHDRFSVACMVEYIKRKGLEETKREIFFGQKGIAA